MAPVPVYAQSGDDSARAEAATAVPARIERARALAAAHQLAAAAAELESLRATAKDDVVRNVTSVMLMNIYLEEGNYGRAEALLDEAFRTRAAEKDRSIRTYFALAGQAVNGARSHLARYRSFGLNVLDAALPSEAVNDLERLRSLLERMIAQAKEIARGESRAYDSLALLEDVLGIRLSLARDSEDREKWETEYAVARQGLASRRQIASLRGMPPQPSTIRSSSPAGVVSSGSSDPRLETPAANTADRSRSSGEGQPSPAGDVSAASAERNGQPAGVVLESEEAAEPATLNTGMLNSRATKQVPASYPQTAKSAGVEGVVKVYVSVDENGKVKSVFKSDGPPLLKSTAEAAARQWKFPPTLVDGKPARLIGYIEFSFTAASP